MGQSLPAHRRALIVEDEPLFAMGLAADMQALGFDTRDLYVLVHSRRTHQLPCVLPIAP